ncbi:hybrid sensor histidine kinase/response regulator [Massilia glaciei]|uniref:histidine kinase n=1 Tax=Massilia glaciei TaxID=1524097 RepID=A0A2U2HFI8_9BURK|nr:hybrid sensor histidine kinase/response regulator [Massilia glaciei]PWF43107.1 hybrid sensor histidine kinase/response regulator [Massilia glaciei]
MSHHRRPAISEPAGGGRDGTSFFDGRRACAEGGESADQPLSLLASGLDGRKAEVPVTEASWQAERLLLVEEIGRLRMAASERDALLLQNEALCAANENLVLATIDAQYLRDEAQAVNHRQSEFLAMLAHELRNPLAPIAMAASMLAKLAQPTPQLSQVQTIIDRQVKQLSYLLDDLLDAARITSGKITLRRQTIVLADQLATAMETVHSCVAARGQLMELHVPSGDIMLDADPTRLVQVVSNLLVNASKFTPDHGKIVLTAWRADDTVKITVADNGAGIAADVLPNIFSLFAQGPRSLARSEGGLGIGLNVVRKVVEMHGGTVEASSEGLGHGSVFTVTLPCPPKPRAAAPQLPQRGEGRRHSILLVEDNRDASEMLEMLLLAEGHSVVTAFDGPAGLAAARARRFDVLICDIGLPGLSGYDLMRELRASADADIPFAIALSGYGQADDLARGIGAGFARHLVKPVDFGVLSDLLASL